MRKKGFMPIRVGKAFYAQINRCAGAGPGGVFQQNGNNETPNALALFPGFFVFSLCVWPPPWVRPCKA